jgi:hypothetical protein
LYKRNIIRINKAFKATKVVLNSKWQI